MANTSVMSNVAVNSRSPLNKSQENHRKSVRTPADKEQTGVPTETVRMLSYEDIFMRHHTTPLSYLNKQLDSTSITRRPPVVLRSPIFYRRSRPLSSPDLDTVPRLYGDSHKLTKTLPPKTSYLKTIPPKPRFFNDNYRLAATFPDRHLTRREIPLCTPDDLLDIIREPTGYYALPTDPWNEVYPDIYLSDAPTALCTSVLKRMGITHVLNAAQGKEKGCGQVNTWPGFYLESGIKFLGVPAFDNVVFRIYPYFDEAAEFIEDGLKSNGKVLVHCRAGISRSATLVCAFLMMKRGMSAQEAVRRVRKNRAIIPNDGFLQQLCDLNDKLKRKPKL